MTSILVFGKHFGRELDCQKLGDIIKRETAVADCTNFVRLILRLFVSRFVFLVLNVCAVNMCHFFF